MAKKPTEDEFDDIFDVDDDGDDEDFLEDDDEDFLEDDDDDDEAEDDEDDEDFEDFEEAVEAGQQENNAGVSLEVLTEALKTALDAQAKTFLKDLGAAMAEHHKATRLHAEGHLKNITDKLAKLQTHTPSAPKEDSQPKAEKQPKEKKKKSAPDKKKSSEEPSPPKELSEKAQAAVLSAYGKKKNRKGTDALKFASKVSEKKFKGSYTPEQIVDFLVAEKLVGERGKSAGLFKK